MLRRLQPQLALLHRRPVAAQPAPATAAAWLPPTRHALSAWEGAPRPPPRLATTASAAASASTSFRFDQRDKYKYAGESARRVPQSREHRSPVTVTVRPRVVDAATLQSVALATRRPDAKISAKAKGKGKGKGKGEGEGEGEAEGEGEGERGPCDPPPKKKAKKKPKVCKVPTKPPCPPDPCAKKRRRWWLWLLAALLGLGGLYYMGFSDWLLGPPPPFPGLGRPRKRKGRNRNPVHAEDLPECVTHLVVGGGSAGIAAARAIRASDKNAQVLIVNAENAFPYQRTPLSKELWQGGAGACFVSPDGTLRSVFYEPDNFFVDCKAMQKGSRGIAVARGWEVQKLRLKEHCAVLQDGQAVRYEKCLLATGTSPYNLAVFDRASCEIQKKVLLLHDVCDFELLRAALRGGAKDIVVVGSCSDACELATSLARHGHQMHIPGLRVTLVYPDETPNAKVLPVYLGKYLARRLEEEGVRMVPKAVVRGAALKSPEHVELRLSTGDRLPVCRVVVVAAYAPNTDLARGSGLSTDWTLGGFKVNSCLFAKDDVWAAGDCASFCSPLFGRIRFEGLDHALTSGKQAGINMVASQGQNLVEAEPYCHLPVRWANMANGAAYEAVGEVDTTLPTVGIFAPLPESERVKIRSHTVCEQGAPEGVSTSADLSHGVVFYLRDNIVVGVLLWNLSKRVAAAKEIVGSQIHYEDLDEAVRKLYIHA